MKIKDDSRQQLNSESPQLQIVPRKLDTEIRCHFCGSSDYSKAGINSTGKRRYRCRDCKRKFVENPEDRTAESDDVLSATKLGLRVNHYQRSGDKLNLSKIKQSWFKELAIKYVRYKAGNRELATLRVALTSFRSFSRFLSEIDCVQGMNNISRSVIIDYISYLNCQKLSPQTKNERLSKLGDFFETGVVNNWFVIPPHLIRKEDHQKEIKALPRYIPE